jgi:hypothetical protein
MKLVNLISKDKYPQTDGFNYLTVDQAQGQTKSIAIITVGASAFNNLNSLYNQAVSKDLSWRISTHAKLASPVVCCSDESQTRYHRLLHMPLVWRQQWMQTPLWNPPPRRFRMARSPRIRRDQASYREVEHERYRSSPRRPGAESRLPGSGGTRKSTRLTSLEFLVKRRAETAALRDRLQHKVMTLTGTSAPRGRW